MEPERILFLATLGGLSGAFLHTASTYRDFAVPFGSCMVMWLFSFDYPLPDLQHMAGIYVFALALGIGAYRMKAADAEAVISEVIICLLVIFFADIFWFLLLLSFYLLGSGFTRYKYARKQELRIAGAASGGIRTSTATASSPWRWRSSTESMGQTYSPSPSSGLSPPPPGTPWRARSARRLDLSRG